VSPTTIIAIYAAFVASAALIVQYAQWRSSRTRLKVSVNAGTAPILSEEEDPYGQKLRRDGEVLFIQITNRSPHQVKITHVGVISAGRRNKKGAAFIQPYPFHAQQLPFEIPARDNVTLWQPRGGLKEWEGRRMQASIRTAAGDDFESSVFRLDDLSRLEVVG
jgi:hypothetical protein